VAQEVVVDLHRIVATEIHRLKSLNPDTLRQLPEVSERSCEMDTVSASVCVFREHAKNDRTVIVVKVFRHRLFWSDAVADGFAVDAANQLVPLLDEERATLY
jgi:hypothetical protein